MSNEKRRSPPRKPRRAPAPPEDPARRDPPPAEQTDDARVDESSLESFPASDPPSWTPAQLG